MTTIVILALTSSMWGASVSTTTADLPVDTERTRAAVDAINVANATVQTLDLGDKPMANPEFKFKFENAEWTMRLQPYSVRAMDFQVLVQQADGTLKAESPPPPHTYRGEIVEQPGSRVAASIIDGKVTALISLPRATWHIQPVPVIAGETKTLHAVYENQQILPDWSRGCGVGDDEAPLVLPANGDGAPAVPQGAPGFVPSGATRAASIAFDADYEYYQANGSSVTATVLDIEDILNGVDQIYRAEVDIAYILRTIIVRANVNDPYTTGLTAQQMRDQFAAEWIANQGGIVRDVAHLMSNRVSSNGFIGFAYFAGICNANGGANSGYAYSQGRYTTNHANRVAVVTHELGHNWNAVHCDGEGDCGIMCSQISGCTGDVVHFGNTARTAINALAAGIACFDTLTDPVFVNGGYFGFENGSLFFPYNTVREGVWGVTHWGGTVSVTAGTYSETLLLNRPMTIQSGGGTVVIAP